MAVGAWREEQRQRVYGGVRCIGLAIWKGQAEGRIVKSGDIGGGRKAGGADAHPLVKPAKFLGDSHTRCDTYAMTGRRTGDSSNPGKENQIVVSHYFPSV